MADKLDIGSGRQLEKEEFIVSTILWYMKELLLKCPYCNLKMDDAIIQSTTQVYFLKTLPPLNNPRLAYARVRLTAKGSSSLPVSYCIDCKKVMLELMEV